MQGLNVGGDGREDETRDEEDIDDTEAQASSLLQDGPEGRNMQLLRNRSHQGGTGGVL